MSIKNKQQIALMLKQKVVNIDTIVQRKGIIMNFLQLAQEKFISLTKNILGDYSYQRKNRFSVDNKIKILDYLKEKSYGISNKLDQEKKKQYCKYNQGFFENYQQKSLTQMKEMLLKGKSEVDAVESSLERLKISRDYIRAQFLNEAAYEFDKQRYTSMYWGFFAGCLINSTLYKKGRLMRKTALLATLIHIFGQVSYHLNLDKYFDSVYLVYEQQAQAYMKQQRKRQKQHKVFIKNNIQA